MPREEVSNSIKLRFDIQSIRKHTRWTGNYKTNVQTGVDIYCTIQSSLKSKDLKSLNKKDFVRFYGLNRMCRQNDHKAVFDLLEKLMKHKLPLDLTTVMQNLEFTGKHQGSLASKLIATVDDKRPVLDYFVLRNFGMRMPYGINEGDLRRQKTEEIYRKLKGAITNILDLSFGNLMLEEFDNRILVPPGVKLSDMKKIDLILWQHRPIH